MRFSKVKSKVKYASPMCLERIDVILVPAITLLIVVAASMGGVLMRHPAYEVREGSGRADFPVITQARMRSSLDSKWHIVDIPFSKKGQLNEVLTFEIDLLFHQGERTQFRLIPDDCMEEYAVNGQSVGNDVTVQAKRCEWKMGWVQDLAAYLHEGHNTITITIKNISGLTGLQFFPVAGK